MSLTFWLFTYTATIYYTTKHRIVRIVLISHTVPLLPSKRSRQLRSAVGLFLFTIVCYNVFNLWVFNCIVTELPTALFDPTSDIAALSTALFDPTSDITALIATAFPFHPDGRSRWLFAWFIPWFVLFTFLLFQCPQPYLPAILLQHKTWDC